MDTGGPKRVKLDQFTITVSPTEYALTFAQAREIKEVAEDIVDPYFATYDWGPSTLYDYMGFTNVEAVSFYQSYSVIHVKGGIVSFDGSSQVIPSHAELQEMIQELLDPTDGSPGLTEALQETQDFSYVVESIYDVLWEPTPSPATGTTSIAPVAAPTENHIPDVSGISSSSPKDSSTGMSIPLLAGIVAAVLLLASAAALLVYHRRRSAAVWLKNADHSHPEEDDLEALALKKGLHTRDAAAMSDAGSSRSSRLGRLLSATAAAVHGGAIGNAESEATPPQSSSEGSEADDFLEFDGKAAVVVEPIILPVHEQFDAVEQDNQGTIINQDNDKQEERGALPNTVGNESECLSTPAALAVATLAGTAGLNRWSDVSSNHSRDITPGDDQQEFKSDQRFEAVEQDNQVTIINQDSGILEERRGDVLKTDDKESECLSTPAALVVAALAGTAGLDRLSNMSSYHSPDLTSDYGHQEFKSDEHFETVEQDNQVAIINQDSGLLEDERGDVMKKDDNESECLSTPAVLAVAALAGTAGLDRWSDLSSNHSRDFAPDDDHQEFKLVERSEVGEKDEQVTIINQDNEEREDGPNTVENEYGSLSTPAVLAAAALASSSGLDRQSDAVSYHSRDFAPDDGHRGFKPDARFESTGQGNQLVTIIDHHIDMQEKGEDAPNTFCNKSECLSSPSVLAAAALSGNAGFDRWSDVSSNDSRYSISDDDQEEFKPDESWDFNDNDDDSEVLEDDPFQTPNDISLNDQKPLLRNELKNDEESYGLIDETCSNDDDSDAVLADPFQTPSTIPSNDMKPLLQHLGTYKLEKVLRHDSNKRQRSKSAPPLVKDRTVAL